MQQSGQVEWTLPRDEFVWRHHVRGSGCQAHYLAFDFRTD